MTSPGKLSRIDSIFAQLFKKKNWGKKLALYGIFAKWPEVVSREIAAKTAPRLIRGTVLWIAVSDSVWMQQLHLQKQALLARINEELAGEGLITDIRFQLETGIAGEKEPAKPPAASPPKVVDPGKKHDFERMLAAVADVDLRAGLLALWEKDQRR